MNFKEVLNLILKLIVIAFVFASMIITNMLILHVVHERTHIQQIEEHGTAKINDVCYFGKSFYSEDTEHATGWVSSTYDNSTLTNGASEEEAYNNQAKAENILLIIDGIILLIILYYFFIEKEITSNSETKLLRQGFIYPNNY